MASNERVRPFGDETEHPILQGKIHYSHYFNIFLQKKSSKAFYNETKPTTLPQQAYLVQEDTKEGN
jgi:hypothetical protein